MAASDLELDAQRPPASASAPASASRVNGSAAIDEHAAAPLEPCAPHVEIDLHHPSSQITLPSTEVPASPIDPASSFKTEVNDDRPAVTVIPSSLTPPPSTQVAPPDIVDDDGDAARALPPSSQPSALFSPPATILNTMRDREPASEDYVPPAPRQLVDASADELRALLQTCIAEHQKLKTEAAHHKLQFNLLTLQADEESKRAAVEHDMVRRQVDALRMAEHSRQARRELGGASESVQSKYLQMKAWYEAAMEENESLHRRVKVAKKVIQQKEEETIGLMEEREMLLNRIRENREHFHMLCSPGGIFHGALTPKHPSTLSPQQQVPQPQPPPPQQQQQQQQRATPQRATPRALRRDNSDTREHGLSALLEAMNQSQDHANNNSAPTTPMVAARPAPRLMGRHHRNAQSMSSLPTTPMNRPARDSNGGLLPSVNLVAQTEPRLRHSQRRYGAPSTPPLRRASPHKSRESTISAEDNEQLARQAVESAKAAQSILAADAMRQLAGLRPRQGLEHGSHHHHHHHHQQQERKGEERWPTHAAARDEVPRRRADDRVEMADAPRGHGERLPSAVLAELLADSSARGEKRMLGSEGAAGEPAQPRGSPSKKVRLGGPASDNPRVGLGIQYRR